jgi:hypothetical protein
MKTVTLLIVFLTVFTMWPQKKIQVGAGYDVAFPTGKLADIATAGSNWSLFGEFPLNEKWGIGLLTGYMTMPVEDYSIAYQNQVISFHIKSIPVKAFAKYYMVEGFFIQAETGVSFTKLAAELTDFNGNTETKSADYEAKFTIGGGVGASFRLSDMSLFNLTGRYMFVDGGDASFDLSHFLLGVSLIALFDI